MFHTNKYLPKLFLNSFIAVAILAPCFLLPVPVDAQSKGKKFDLRAIRDDYLKPAAGPSLSREDIDNNGDPFGSGGEETFDAPQEAFQEQTPTAAKPPAFDLNANRSGGFNGKAMPAMGEQVPNKAQAAPQKPTMAQMNPNDPDSSQQMQLAWDAWHRRVAENIYLKFNTVAKWKFARNRRPMAAKVAYMVDRNHRVGNIRFTQKSPSLIFNMLIMGVLQSMNGSPVLTFPPGSRRTMVEKTGTFLWNYNQRGFKYTTGDRETLGK